jgi:hypothetical protein
MALSRQKAKLRKLLKHLLTEPTASPTSDIAQTLTESVETLRTAARRQNGHQPTRIAMFSDLLENTAYMPTGKFKQLPPKQAVARWREHGAVPNLADIDIDVWGYGRGHGTSREPLPAKVRARIEKSWRRLFREAGASSVRITYRR